MFGFLNRWRFPGSETIQSFIGRRILGAFSLIRLAILVTGVANVLLFQYLDAAEVQERNKTAEQGKLDHLSFVVDTQIQTYESAVWETGKLPNTVSAARDLYTGEATADVLALRKLDPALLAPGGALHAFVLRYLQLNELWRALAPAIALGGDRAPLQAQWQSRQDLIAAVPQELAGYTAQVAQEQQRLQRAKADAKQGAIILSGIIGVISFALSIGLAVALTRQIVPPVTRLRDALQLVAAGDLSPQAPMHGKDEISQLLTTFNASVGRLGNLLMAVHEQAQAISAEAVWLKATFAGDGLNPRAAAALADTLATAGRLAQATDEVAALVEPTAPGQALLPATPEDGRALAPAGDGPAPAGELSGERARVLEELTQGVEGISVRLSAVTDRAARLATGVPGRGAPGAPAGPRPAWLVAELQALDADAQAAATQLATLIGDVQNTQHMTATAIANLDRAAQYLHTAVAQFHVQG